MTTAVRAAPFPLRVYPGRRQVQVGADIYVLDPVDIAYRLCHGEFPGLDGAAVDGLAVLVAVALDRPVQEASRVLDDLRAAFRDGTAGSDDRGGWMSPSQP
jgi:hypothetical protein